MKSFFSSVGWILFLAGLAILAIFSRRVREIAGGMLESVVAVIDWHG